MKPTNDYAYLYLDLEFTSLDPDENEIWAIGWILDGPQTRVRDYIVQHDYRLVSDWVLQNTDYQQEVFGSLVSGPLPTLDHALKMLERDCTSTNLPINDIFLVGSEPILDMEYLRRAFKIYGITMPFSWRCISIQSYAQGVLKLPKPVSTERLRKLLGIETTYNIHSTNGDNAEVRDIHKILQNYEGTRK